jgi:acid stress chaperone HdeB
MKLYTAVLAAAALAWNTPGNAGNIDLSTWTCQQFQSASRDDVAAILAWLDGYYKDEDDPPVVDTDRFAADAQRLGEYCAAHPDIGLITATDKLFQKE